MIQGLWAAQGPIFSQNTDATDRSWNVLSQDVTRLALRIESHATYAVAPNQAASSATVSFTLPVAGRADVGVFDLSGRRVATLADGEQSAGEHTLRWNGEAAGGTHAAPELYLVRVRTNAGEAVRRLAWLE
jgi:hypothetical protein